MISRFALSLVNLIVGFIEIILAARIILKFLGASSGHSLVVWVYSVSAPLVQPFTGILNSISFERFFLDVPALIALVVFAVVASLIESLIYQTR